jgi:hypothetical protein
MKKTPLSQVNDEFGGKEKLVDAIVDAVERGDEEKNALKKRLLAASNSKLMRLLKTAQEVKQLGGRGKLVDAVAEKQGKPKDKDYRTRLESYTIGRLLDMYRVGTRNGRPGGEPPTKPKPARTARPKSAKTSAKKKGKAA